MALLVRIHTDDSGGHDDGEVGRGQFGQWRSIAGVGHALVSLNSGWPNGKPPHAKNGGSRVVPRFVSGGRSRHARCGGPLRTDGAMVGTVAR